MTTPVPCYRCHVRPCECKDGVALYAGDCREVMATMPENSVDAIVCDPPYGLEFMGKEWDHGVPGVPFWTRALRVAKPGCHLLAFGGTRTFHRLACAIEDAGWEIRDTIMWLYGSGFPKSLDVSKAIDKAAGAEREVGRPVVYGDGHVQNDSGGKVQPYSGGYSQVKTGGTRLESAPATSAAREWSGWGTALKPAWEPVIVARKPLDGTVAANVQKWGTGALNIDGCRIPIVDQPIYGVEPKGRLGYSGGIVPSLIEQGQETLPGSIRHRADGRFPTNLIHDGSEEVVAMFPESKSTGGGGANHAGVGGGFIFGSYGRRDLRDNEGLGDSGSAARFFYCAKTSRAERGEGNTHPTVKPLALMEYLCRLVSLPGHRGVLLDPFAGSGSTLLAATRWFERAIGIEQNDAYCAIAAERLAGHLAK